MFGVFVVSDAFVFLLSLFSICCSGPQRPTSLLKHAMNCDKTLQILLVALLHSGTFDQDLFTHTLGDLEGTENFAFFSNSSKVRNFLVIYSPIHSPIHPLTHSLTHSHYARLCPDCFSQLIERVEKTPDGEWVSEWVSEKAACLPIEAIITILSLTVWVSGTKRNIFAATRTM